MKRGKVLKIMGQSMMLRRKESLKLVMEGKVSLKWYGYVVAGIEVNVEKMNTSMVCWRVVKT